MFGPYYTEDNARYSKSNKGTYLFDEVLDYLHLGILPARLMRKSSSAKRSAKKKFFQAAENFSIGHSNQGGSTARDIVLLYHANQQTRAKLGSKKDDIEDHSLRKSRTGTLIVVRKEEAIHIAAREHAKHHQGINKLEAHLRTVYRFPGGIRETCARVVNACEQCAKFKKVRNDSLQLL